MVKKKKTLSTYAAAFASKGGKARAKALTSEERKLSAQRAAKARWAKGRKKQ